MKAAIVLLSLITISLSGLILGVPRINAWEAANNYPYGHMCDSVFTGFVNTCNK
jgi:hypothetical protein